MCGVFGFVSYDGKGPNIKRLARIAEVTMRRGPHAFGFAWLDWSGRMHMFKKSGRIIDHLGLLAMAKNARVLIGHCRFATHGSPSNNLNNHPHPADGGWIVHNGVVTNHEELAAEYDLWPVTECDSEVLGLLVAGSRGNFMQRCGAAANVAKGQPRRCSGSGPIRRDWSPCGRGTRWRSARPTAASGSISRRCGMGCRARCPRCRTTRASSSRPSR